MASGGRCFLGIDVGLDGAVAILTDGAAPQLWDTPTIAVRAGQRRKREYDIAEMDRQLRGVKVELAGLELVHAFPGQGVSSMFALGQGLGIWKALLTAAGIPYELVAPQKWKAAMLEGMPKGKGASIVVAKRLFPEASLDRKKDHGRADALLLAEYMRRRAAACEV